MKMSIKIGSVISDAQTKAAKIIKKAPITQVSEKANKIIPETQKVVSETINPKATISLSEALRAQTLVDYQYAADAHLLGCSPEEQLIQAGLRYCGDLSTAREKIKTKTLFKSAAFQDENLRNLCKKHGEDKVLAEINARLNGCYWVGDGSNPRISDAFVSAHNIAEANGWGHRSAFNGKWIID